MESGCELDGNIGHQASEEKSNLLVNNSKPGHIVITFMRKQQSLFSENETTLCCYSMRNCLQLINNPGSEIGEYNCIVDSNFLVTRIEKDGTKYLGISDEGDVFIYTLDNSSDIFVHGPDLLYGMNDHDLILCCLTVFHNQGATYLWYRDGEMIMEGKNLCLIKVSSPGIYSVEVVVVKNVYKYGTPCSVTDSFSVPLSTRTSAEHVSMPTLKSGHSSGTETTIGPSKYVDDMSVEQKCVTSVLISKVNIEEQIIVEKNDKNGTNCSVTDSFSVPLSTRTSAEHVSMPTLKSGHSSGTETTIGPSKYVDDMSVEQKCVTSVPISKVNIEEQIVVEKNDKNGTPCSVTDSFSVPLSTRTSAEHVSMPTLKSGHSSGTETTIGPSKYCDDMSVEQKCVTSVPISKVNIEEQIVVEKMIRMVHIVL